MHLSCIRSVPFATEDAALLPILRDLVQWFTRNDIIESICQIPGGWRLTPHSSSNVTMHVDDGCWLFDVDSMGVTSDHFCYNEHTVRSYDLAMIVGQLLRHYRVDVEIETEDEIIEFDSNKYIENHPWFVFSVTEKASPSHGRCALRVFFHMHEGINMAIRAMREFCWIGVPKPERAFGLHVVRTEPAFAQLYLWPGLWHSTTSFLSTMNAMMPFGDRSEIDMDMLLAHLHDPLVKWVISTATPEQRRELFHGFLVVNNDVLKQDLCALHTMGMCLSKPVLVFDAYEGACTCEQLRDLAVLWLRSHPKLFVAKSGVFERWYELPDGFPRRLLYDEVWLPLDKEGKEVAITSEQDVTPEMLMEMFMTNPRMPQWLAHNFRDKWTCQRVSRSAPRRKKLRKHVEDERARSPFAEFCSEKRPELKAAHPNASFGELGKMLQQLWAETKNNP